MRAFAPLIVAVALLATASLTKDHVEESTASRRLAAPVIVPTYAVAITAALGLDSFAADLVWLRSLEYFGDRRFRERKFDAIVPLYDLAIALDPKFCALYQKAGLILTSSEITDMPAANRLLAKGVDECPDDGYIPFLHGFNLYFFQRRFKEASEYLMLAADRGGVKIPWLRDLAVRVAAADGDLTASLDMLAIMAEAEPIEDNRKAIEARILAVRTEILLRRLDALIAQYNEAHRAAPLTSLLELVTAGLIGARELVDPSGGELFVKDGKAQTTAYPRRLELGADAVFHEVVQ